MPGRAQTAYVRRVDRLFILDPNTRVLVHTSPCSVERLPRHNSNREMCTNISRKVNGDNVGTRQVVVRAVSKRWMEEEALRASCASSSLFPRHRNLLWRIGRGNSPPPPLSSVYARLDPLTTPLNGIVGPNASNEHTTDFRRCDNNRDITRVRLRRGSRGMYLGNVSFTMDG